MSGNVTFPPNNSMVHKIAQIINNVMSSAAKAELGALFLKAKQAEIMQTTLKENPQPPTPIQTNKEHPQPPTPIVTNNSTPMASLQTK